MFRLLSLNINDWQYLGHIPAGKLNFVPNEEQCLTELPYTTVLIGPNGTGKSTLLSYLVKIFEDIKYFKENTKRNPTAISFPYSISYKIGSLEYRITHNNKGLDIQSFEQEKRRVKWVYYLQINNTEVSNWDDVKLPEQIIAVSYLPMDRFRQKSNLPNDYYQYLGLRHRSNAASPQYFLNNTLPLLFNFIAENRSISFLKSILEFMSLDPSFLGVQLVYRYKKYFFSGVLTVELFKQFFLNPKLYTKRVNSSYAEEYYNKYIKEDEVLIARIVSYLNYRTKVESIVSGEKSLLEFNLFENVELIEELSLIRHLQKLDLLSSASLTFKKNQGSIIDSSDLSSGEFHFLTTMIAIQSTIKNNSLILIDEPDTSLHPNWQMKYIHNLKHLFKKWNNSHFILATHSHFIISDLENDSSEVIGLKGSIPNIKVTSFNFNTYGWSPDEILYKVFELRTIRNHFFEYDLLQLANQLSSKQKDIDIIRSITDKFDKYTFSKEDPLNKLIAIAKGYLKRVN
jgi:predicted ATPase